MGGETDGINLPPANKFESISNSSIGMILLLIGLGFAVIGLTIIPFFELLIAAPILIAGLLFIKAHRSAECVLEDQMAKGGAKQ